MYCYDLRVPYYLSNNTLKYLIDYILQARLYYVSVYWVHQFKGLLIQISDQSFMTTVCHPMAASSKITLPVRQQLHDDIMSLRTKISLILLFVYFWNIVWHGSIVKVS